MKKILTSIFIALCLMTSIFCFSGCFKQKYEIKFMVENAVVKTIETTGNITIELPEDPEKAGYIFDGWYFDKDTWQNPCTENSFVEIKVTKDVYVYAKWTELNNNVEAQFSSFTQTNTFEYSRKVENLQSTLSLENLVSVEATSSWVLKDSSSNEIANKIASLLVGDNTYYVEVTAENGASRVYTLKIRRRPIYTVSFNTDNGTSVPSQSIEEDDFASVPTITVTRVGYDFTGWNFDFSTAIMGDITINASWSGKAFKVTYNADGGEVENSYTDVVYGDNYILEVPTKEGYDFLGWYNTLDEKIEDGTWLKLENLSVKAKWQGKAFKVMYDADGGEVENSYTDVVYGDSYTLEVPTKEGYEFLGWYNTLDEKIEDGTWLKLENLSVKAKWQEKPKVFSVTLVTKSLNTTNKTISVTYGEPMPNYTAPVADGYLFLGYFIEDDVNSTQYYSSTMESLRNWDIEGDRSLYAMWKAITYTVRYDAGFEGYDPEVNGVVEEQTATYNVNYYLRQNAFTREGYTFVGWTRDLNDNTCGIWAGGYHIDRSALHFTTVNNKIVTLYAVWEGQERTVILTDRIATGKYTVTFDENYRYTDLEQVTHTGAKTNVTIFNDDDYTTGENYLYYPNYIPTRPYDERMQKDFLFGGWYTLGGNLFEFGSEITSDMILKAKWVEYSELNMYELHTDFGYNEISQNDLKWFVFAPIQNDYNVIQIRNCNSIFDFYVATWKVSDVSTYDNFIYKEVEKSVDATGRDDYYRIDLTGLVEAGKIYYLAIDVHSSEWEEYELGFFSPMPDEVSKANFKPTENIVTLGETYTLDVPRKTGHNFMGWYDGVGGTGTQLTDEKGNSLGVWTIVQDFANVYAKWEKVNFTLTFETNGGEAIEPIKMPYESVLNELPTPTQAGKTFVGWFNEELTTQYTSYTFNGSATFYAKWIDYDIELTYDNITEMKDSDNFADISNYNATAVDTDGATLEVSARLKEGQFVAGNNVIIELKASGLYETTKTIELEIKVYGEISISFNEEKDFINIHDTLNKELFNIVAKDSFNNELDIEIKAKQEEYNIKDIITIIVSATDIVGNSKVIEIENIVVYGNPVISRDETINKMNETDTISNEFFKVSAKDSFNEDVVELTTALESGEVKGGNIITIKSTAIDKKGNINSISYEIKVYGAPVIQDATKNAFLVTDEITLTSLGIVGTDSFGGELQSLELEFVSGEKLVGNKLTYKVKATDIYGNFGEKEIIVKICGNPTLELDESVTAIKDTDKLTAELFNVVAKDEFGDDIEVVVTLASGEFKGGQIATFNVLARDGAGNEITKQTGEIKIYSAEDIVITSNILGIKENAVYEELDVTATDSFGEECIASLETIDGFEYVSGNTVNIYVVATDILGNTIKLLLENVKVYGMPTYTIEDIIYTNSNFNNVIKVYDTFGSEIAKNVTYNGNLIPNDINELTITATDCAKNILEVKVPIYIYSGDLEIELSGEEVILVKYSGTATDLTLPSRITSIKESAFENRTTLKNVAIPSSVTSIGLGAFKGCTSLESLTIPFVGKTVDAAGIEAILGHIFGYEIGNYGSQIEGTIKANIDNTWYHFYIPSSLSTVNVTNATNIPANAFYLCENIKNISINSGVETIGYSSMYKTGIKSITIPNTVKSINRAAFYQCINLENVIFEEISIVESLSQNLFSGCSSLKEIIVPNSVTSLGRFCFYGCSSLESLTIPFIGKTIDATEYESVFGYLFGYTENTTKTQPENTKLQYSIKVIPSSPYEPSTTTYYYYYIPASLREVNITKQTIIPDNAFINCDMLTKITIPSGTTSIGTYAFSGCKALESFEIPSNITIINERTFENCHKLQAITIPKNVTRVSTRAFYYCKELKTIEFEEDSLIKNIDTFAFYDCYKLEEINIETTTKLQVIDEYAFASCTSLKEIELPNCLKTIGYWAFNNCSSLEKITIPFIGNGEVSHTGYGGNSYGYERVFGSIFGYVVYSEDQGELDGLTQQCSGIFDGATKTQYYYYYIPSSLKIVEITTTDTIQSKSFINCKMLEAIIIPNTVITIGSSAFENCTSLKSIVVPNSVSNIGVSILADCTSLQSITMPYLGNYLGYYAYYSAGYEHSNPRVPESLKTITLTSGEKLADNYFNGCKYIENVCLPSTMTELGNYGFYGCSALKNIDISNITKIGDYCFAGCPFDILSLSNSIASVGNNAFESCEDLTEVLIDKNVTVLGEKVFYNCTNLVSVVFAEDSNITDIGEYAFYKCTSLTNVILPKSLTIINKNAFYKCTALESITIPASVEYINESAFANCSALQTINFASNNTLKQIGVKAFISCSSLKTIALPSSINWISNETFKGCNALESMSLPFVGESLDYYSDSYNTVFGYIFGYTTSTKNIIDGAVCQYEEDGTYYHYYIPTSLTTVELTNTGTLSSNAFINCNFIKDIKVVSAWTIKETAFANCTGLEKIEILSCENIENNVFVPCVNLKTLSINKVNGFIGAYFGGSTYEDNEEVLPVSLKNIIWNSSSTINAYAFTNCSNITTINFTYYTIIGMYAFSNCTSLTNVIISKGGSFGEGVFANCTKLKEFTLHEGTTKVGTKLLMGCNNLEELTISLKDEYSNYFPYISYFFGGESYEDNAILLPETLKTVNISNGLSLRENLFNGAKYIETINMADTYRFNNNAVFKNCASLKNIKLSTNLQAIYSSMFEGCSSLESIVLPDSIKFIKVNGFKNCSSLKTINIPSATSLIEDNAFAGCTALEEIVIPNTVTTLGVNILGGATNLKTLTVAKLDNFLGEYFGGETYEDNAEVVPTSLKTLTITDIESIKEYAFAGCTGLETINIPESVTAIGNNAFENCSSLTTINLPENITEIKENTFAGCSGLETIKLPETLKIIGANAFKNSGLKTIAIPSSVVTIGDNAFASCTALEEIVIPNTVINLGVNILGGATNLKTLTVAKLENFLGEYFGGETYEDNAQVVPTSLKTLTITDIESVKEYAFAGCTGLETINLPEGLETIGNYAFANCINLKTINLPESVRVIGNNAFENCSSLATINLPENLKELGNYAFYNCSSLSFNTYDNAKYLGNGENDYFILISVLNTSIQSCEINENTKFIYSAAFMNCASLTEITIPSGVRGVGKDAFKNCTGITKVNATSLEEWLNIKFDFGYSNPVYYAKNLYLNGELLEELVIPNTITTISNSAFYNCESLTSLFIHNKVTKIGGYAFENCINIETITFEENSIISIIDISAFRKCEKITEINIPNTVTYLGDYMFANCANLANVHLPNKIEFIGIDMFIFCNKLTEITIPSSVTEIRQQAFYGCNYLKTVNFEGESKLESIGNHAFYNNHSLEITIPSSVKTIGDSAFANYAGVLGVSSIKFESNSKLESIGREAFYNSVRLTEIILPSTVTNIGADAFKNCTNLTIYLEQESIPQTWDSAWNSSNLQVFLYSETTPTVEGNFWHYENNEVVVW